MTETAPHPADGIGEAIAEYLTDRMHQVAKKQLGSDGALYTRPDPDLWNEVMLLVESAYDCMARDMPVTALREMRAAQSLLESTMLMKPYLELAKDLGDLVPVAESREAAEASYARSLMVQSLMRAWRRGES